MLHHIGLQIRFMRFFLAILILLVFTFGAGAAVRYMKADVTGANNGTSWTNAYTDLQSAFSVAVAGDQVWMARETYTPDGGTKNRSAAFVLVEGAKICGGFAGRKQDT